MDKLELDLDDLKVESFHSSPENANEQGTVYGQDTGGDACYTVLEHTCPYHKLFEPCTELC